MRDAAAAVAEARHLHEHVDGRADLLAHGTRDHIGISHADHDLQTPNGIARIVGVDGSQRSIVTRIHGLEHIERLLAPYLTDDDSGGPHTEGIDDEVANADGAVTFDVGWAGFHARYMCLAQPQLGGIFDGRSEERRVGNESLYRD